MFRLASGFITAAFLSLAAVPVHATIVGGAVTGGSALGLGGVFVNLTVPFSSSSPTNTVGEDNFQNPNLYGFNEEQNIVLTSTVTVDIGTSPTAGQEVASHYIFFDPLSTGTSQPGYVLFDADIYGIATSTANMNASDFLANTGVNYLNPTLRGLESGDFVSIDGSDAKRLNVNWTAASPGDYVRVFTMHSELAELPEPGTLLVFLGGLLTLAAARKRA